jgi:hypothetical protein
MTGMTLLLAMTNVHSVFGVACQECTHTGSIDTGWIDGMRTVWTGLAKCASTDDSLICRFPGSDYTVTELTYEMVNGVSTLTDSWDCLWHNDCISDDGTGCTHPPK